MALSLRKHLGRRTGLMELKPPADQNSASSSEPSLASAGKEATNKGGLETVTQKSIVAQDDLSTTPPPTRKLRSSKDFSRDKTPPQSLLQKYQSKTAKQALPALSNMAIEREKGNGMGRKDSTVNEASVEAFAPTPTSPTRVKRESAESNKTGETRKVRGVEFDMVNQSSTSAPKSENSSSAETTRRGPATQGPASLGRRRTRSLARREEREEAKSKDEELLSDGLAALTLDLSLEPLSLSVRKVTRTPSPKGDRVDRDGYGEEKVKVAASPPILPLFGDDFIISKEPAAGLTDLGTKGKVSDHDERRDAIDHATANLISFPPPPTSTTTSPLSPRPSPPEETLQKAKIKSILKTSPIISNNPSNLRLPISPPRAPLPGALPGYVFTSDKSSSSRPSEPWAWCRRWTCCSCGDGDGLGMSVGGGKGLDGMGMERPAMTMAEQKVCSRLSCGHVRCGVCRLEFRAR